jgi:prevent-host-death family protein
MTQVTVRELQQNIRRVLQRVEAGEVIEVTRRRRPVARLTATIDPRTPSPWPDLAARTRAVFGARTITPAPSRQVSADRGQW